MRLVNGLVHEICCRRFGFTCTDHHASGATKVATMPWQGSWQKFCSSQKMLNLFLWVACQVKRPFTFCQRFVYASTPAGRSG